MENIKYKDNHLDAILDAAYILEAVDHYPWSETDTFHNQWEFSQEDENHFDVMNHSIAAVPADHSCLTAERRR